jgi:hypothetical protein
LLLLPIWPSQHLFVGAQHAFTQGENSSLGAFIMRLSF